MPVCILIISKQYCCRSVTSAENGSLFLLSLFWWKKHFCGKCDQFQSFQIAGGNLPSVFFIVPVCRKWNNKFICGTRHQANNEAFIWSWIMFHLHAQILRASHAACTRVFQYVVLFTDMFNRRSLSAVAPAYHSDFLFPLFLSWDQSVIRFLCVWCLQVTVTTLQRGE